MCGIAGVSGDIAEHAAVAILKSLARRGPDGAMAVRAGPYWLGHTMLAIRDRNMSARQPMQNRDGTIAVVFNGEIYNAHVLAAQLGEPYGGWRSLTDTEILLAAYERWGLDALTRLIGIYALALVDGRGAIPRLILARDCLGVKPLYYTEAGGRLAFASSVEALLAGGFVPARGAPNAALALLALGAVIEPGASIVGVHALSPGAALIHEAGRLQQTELVPLTRAPSSEDAVQVIETEMARAVDAETADQDSIDLFFSGGLDSALLAEMAKIAGHSVRSWTLGLPDSPGLDEGAAAAHAAAALGLEHHTVEIRDEVIAPAFEAFVNDLDQPTLDGFNVRLIAAALPDDARVVFSGTGPDELLFGYSWMVDLYSRFASGPAPSCDVLAGAWLEAALITPSDRFRKRLGHRNYQHHPSLLMRRYTNGIS